MRKIWRSGQSTKCADGGGVLEHPARSRLWTAEAGERELPAPGTTDKWGGWTMVAPQFWWGHKAEKLTRFYIVGVALDQMPEIPLALGEAQYVISTSGRRKDGSRMVPSKPDFPREEMTRQKFREHTPAALAVWLLDVARRSWANEKR